MTTSARPQPLIALDRANEIRFARCQARRDLRAGVITLAQTLDLACCRRMRVVDVLVWQRGWGPHRARRALRAAGCSERLLVEQLTDRQRQVLGEATAS